MFADTFMNIEPIAGWSLGTPGNKRVNKGLTKRPNSCMTPARSPIFINPNHRAKMPVSPKASSKAFAAEANDADMISDHIAKSPLIRVLPIATAKAIRKNDIQM
jgi:hypothetical protein